MAPPGNTNTKQGSINRDRKIRWLRLSWLLGLSILLLAAACAQQITWAAGSANVDKRTFNFPKEFSIGTLYLVSHDENRAGTGDEQALVPAFGTVTVTVPKGKWLMLELNRKAYENPQRLDSIPAEGLDVLQISLISMEDSESTLCDQALIHAKHLKSLKCLLLDRSDVSDKSLMQLSLPNLVFISANTAAINGDCFKTLTKFPKLRTLILYDNALKPENFQYLPLSPNLTWLDLHHAQLTDVGVKYLAQCPNISVLRIGTNATVTNASMKYLLNLKHLDFLDLTGTHVTFAGLKTLGPLHINQLTISQDMCNLKELASLKEVCKHVGVPPQSRVVDKRTKELYAPLH